MTTEMLLVEAYAMAIINQVKIDALIDRRILEEEYPAFHREIIERLNQKAIECKEPMRSVLLKALEQLDQ